MRHNLSLHKCFRRVESSVGNHGWVVDEEEFQQRRANRVNNMRYVCSVGVFFSCVPRFVL